MMFERKLIKMQSFRIPLRLKGKIGGRPVGLPDPGIKLRSLALQVDSLPSEPPEKSHNMRLLFVLNHFHNNKKHVGQYIILVSSTVPIH